jgi:dTDP-4-amino-4,6-dideoxygalactose transaminase
MKAYNKLIKNKKRLKIAEIKSKGIFCLPLYPELRNKEIKTICKNLKEILKKKTF